MSGHHDGGACQEYRHIEQWPHTACFQFSGVSSGHFCIPQYLLHLNTATQGWPTVWALFGLWWCLYCQFVCYFIQSCLYSCRRRCCWPVVGSVVKLAIPVDMWHNMQWWGATKNASGTRIRILGLFPTDKVITYYTHLLRDLFIGPKTPRHVAPYTCDL